MNKYWMILRLQGGFKQNSESYYETLSIEMIESLSRQNKFSENV